MMTRRLFDYPCAKLCVGECENFTYALTRDLGSGPEEMSLYRIRMLLNPGFQEVKIYVLAPNAEGAIDQAKCISKEHHAAEEFLACIPTRIPFGIRGWSHHQF